MDDIELIDLLPVTACPVCAGPHVLQCGGEEEAVVKAATPGLAQVPSTRSRDGRKGGWRLAKEADRGTVGRGDRNRLWKCVSPHQHGGQRRSLHRGMSY